MNGGALRVPASAGPRVASARRIGVDDASAQASTKPLLRTTAARPTLHPLEDFRL